MKPSIILSIVSLVGNLVLGSIWLRRVIQTETTPIIASPPAHVSAAATIHEISTDANTWKQLSAHDDAEFVARLRAAGFPPSMIVALVSLRVKDKHADALNKFRAPADRAYWRREQYQGFLSPEDRIAQRKLSLQMFDELRRSLAGNPYLESILGNDREQRYGNLSSQKIAQLDAINKDYNDLATVVRERANGLMMQEDRDQLTLIEQERRADLAKLLTPGELHEYDLRSSQSAATVRNRLRNFNATEEEFRAITELQLAFDAAYGNGSNLNGEQQDRREAAIAGREAQTKTLLSPERSVEYEIKTDSSYSFISGLVNRFNPGADPDTAVGAQIELARRFNALRGNHDLAPGLRDAQLDMLAAEANQRMAAALGPQAFAAFKHNGGPINALLNRAARKP